MSSLQWYHNERHGVSNHQPLDCLLNCLIRCRSKKTSKLCVTGLCEGNPPVTPTKGQQRRKCFHLMTSSCHLQKWHCLCWCVTALHIVPLWRPPGHCTQRAREWLPLSVLPGKLRQWIHVWRMAWDVQEWRLVVYQYHWKLSWFQLWFYQFHSRKCLWNCLLPKWQSFVQGWWFNCKYIPDQLFYSFLRDAAFQGMSHTSPNFRWHIFKCWYIFCHFYPIHIIAYAHMCLFLVKWRIVRYGKNRPLAQIPQCTFCSRNVHMCTLLITR